MKKLSFEEAKRLSIVKWNVYASSETGYIEWFTLPREVIKLKFRCGFCERWNTPKGVNCKKCEFGKIAGTCTETGSKYDNWLYEAPGRFKRAMAIDILNIIKNLQNENEP